MEQNKETMKNGKQEPAAHVHPAGHVHSHTEENKHASEHKHEEHKLPDTLEHKHEEKKHTPEIKKQIIKKDIAVARGTSLHMSKRHGMYICAFIKNKKIDNAISDLEKVCLLKKAVPFKGEIPHRKGKGMMSGRYPVSAASLFIPILKSLKGNVTVNGMDLTKTKITSASANWASRPARRGGQKGKRAHIILEAKESKN